MTKTLSCICSARSSEQEQHTRTCTLYQLEVHEANDVAAALTLSPTNATTLEVWLESGEAPVLLESWRVELARDRSASSPASSSCSSSASSSSVSNGTNRAAAAHYFTSMCTSLRALHTLLRLLPTHRLATELRRQRSRETLAAHHNRRLWAIKCRLNHDTSGGGGGENPLDRSFTFTPVLTPAGVFEVSVRYARAEALGRPPPPPPASSPRELVLSEYVASVTREEAGEEEAAGTSGADGARLEYAPALARGTLFEAAKSDDQGFLRASLGSFLRELHDLSSQACAAPSTKLTFGEAVREVQIHRARAPKAAMIARARD